MRDECKSQKSTAQSQEPRAKKLNFAIFAVPVLRALRVLRGSNLFTDSHGLREQAD